MKTHILFYFLFLATYSYAQSLEQFVISSAGNFSNTSTGTTLSWTVGEPMISTESSNTAILTQGFQQPIDVNPLSVDIKLNQDIRLQVYPNPTSEQITFQKETDKTLKAELFNMLGKSIGHYSITQRQTNISLQHLPSATYLLRIQDLDQQIIKTFKIQKTR
ncbi:T9SS type A sorting domain-containing protein [Aureispira sp. CCB-QB1]|uniref:T9SS type A sorting domain-containing protein n=1 Tax=Aureispira sp. CCB-QB1 TaxID=1313421 RepID=UPI000695F642|nr:T9SS type A sorting domain-containing protein [Aureispira sp. CCB-QB1]